MTERAPLPWSDVNAAESSHVAALLGLRRAREHRKWSCPVHGGSDSLHAYPGTGRGFYCWGACDRAYSNVDLAAAVWRVEPAEACKRLADQLGIRYDNAPGRSRPTVRRAATPPPPPTFPDPNPDVCAARATVYRSVLELTELEEPGVRYLAGRGLDAEPLYGFRTVLGVDAWRDLWRGLLLRHPRELLESAGMDRPPWHGRASVLLLPYWYGGAIIAFRYRNLDPAAAKGDRYRNTTDAPPPVPFNMSALEALGDGEEVHVTEGELDAWTLHQRGDIAIGIPGVSATDALLHRAARALRPAGQVIVWYDVDELDQRGRRAGDDGFKRFCRAVQAENGGRWLAERVRRRQPIGAKDVNELHLLGAL